MIVLKEKRKPKLRKSGRTERPLTSSTLESYRRSLNEVVAPILEELEVVRGKKGPFSIDDLKNPLVSQTVIDILTGMPNLVASVYGIQKKSYLTMSRASVVAYNRLLGGRKAFKVRRINESLKSPDLSRSVLDFILKEERIGHSFRYRLRSSYEDVARAYGENLSLPEFWRSLDVLLENEDHRLLSPLKELKEPAHGGAWRVRSVSYRTLARKMANYLEFFLFLKEKGIVL